jgi:hypothetical protein
MSPQNLREDLAFVRTLAEEGASAPLLGGRFMVFWGVLVSATLLTHWAIVTDRLAAPTAWLFWIWLGMSIGGGLVSLLLGASISRAPGASAANNRVASAIWSAMGLSLLALFVGVFAAINQGAPLLLWNIFPGAALVLYGMAYLGGAFFHREGLLIFSGVAALTAGAAALALIQSADAYLAAAAGVVASTLIPGVAYVIREPKLTV